MCIFVVLWRGLQQPGTGWRHFGAISESVSKEWSTGKTFYAGCFPVDKTRIDTEKGTIVDSTIISAPSSTKNRDKQCGPDAHQLKKGNTWYFGYKVHIGVDKDSDIVPTASVSLLRTCLKRRAFF